MDELEPDQVAMLKKAFDGFDHEKKGVISTDMVGTTLRMMGQTYNAKTLRELIDELDTDHPGLLEFEQFATLAAKFIIEDDDEAMTKELKEAFRLYDKEGNGFITNSSLAEILKELDDTLSPEDLENIIKEIDTDGSGTLDFDEFMEMMAG